MYIIYKKNQTKAEYRLTGFRYLQPVPAAGYWKTRYGYPYLFAFTFNR